MADARPPQLTALAGIAQPGRLGHATGTPGVTAREVVGCGLATVTARSGRRDALAEVVRSTFAIELPSSPRRCAGLALSMIWTGPEQWLALAPAAPPEGMEMFVKDSIGAHASVADQSHGRMMLTVAGPKARAALAKGLAIDLHPRAFRPSDTAITHIAQIGVQISQLDEAPTYEIIAFRGFAGSLWHWLELSAAEYGLEMLE